MKKCKFSVISVTYGDLPGIERTLASVFSQSYSCFEIIVIDGHKDDSTKRFLESISDDRLFWVSEADSGLYDAMNKGLRFATGDYVIFLNGGDTFFDRKVLFDISSLVDDRVLFGRVLVDSKKYIPPLSVTKDNFRDWLCSSEPNHQSMFVPSDLAKAVGFDLRYKICADLNFKLKLMLICDFSFTEREISVFDGDGVSSRPNMKNYARQYFERKKIVDGLGFPSHYRSSFRFFIKYLFMKLNLLG